MGHVISMLLFIGFPQVANERYDICCIAVIQTPPPSRHQRRVVDASAASHNRLNKARVAQRVHILQVGEVPRPRFQIECVEAIALPFAAVANCTILIVELFALSFLVGK